MFQSPCHRGKWCNRNNAREFSIVNGRFSPLVIGASGATKKDDFVLRLKPQRFSPLVIGASGATRCGPACPRRPVCVSVPLSSGQVVQPYSSHRHPLDLPGFQSPCHRGKWCNERRRRHRRRVRPFQSPCHRGKWCNIAAWRMAPTVGIVFQSPCHRGKWCNVEFEGDAPQIAARFSPLVIGASGATYCPPIGILRYGAVFQSPCHRGKWCNCKTTDAPKWSLEFQSPCHRGKWCNIYDQPYPVRGSRFQSPCHRGKWCNPRFSPRFPDYSFCFSPLVIGASGATSPLSAGDQWLPGVSVPLSSGQVVQLTAFDFASPCGPRLSAASQRLRIRRFFENTLSAQKPPFLSKDPKCPQTKKPQGIEHFPTRSLRRLAWYKMV